MWNPTNARAGGLRRTFLADTGMGFTGLALGAMLSRDAFGSDRRPPGGARPMAGLILPAPEKRDLALHGRRGQPRGRVRSQTRAERLCGEDIAQPRIETARFSPHPGHARHFGNHIVMRTPIFSMQTGYKKYGQSGLDRRVVAARGLLRRQSRRREVAIHDR